MKKLLLMLTLSVAVTAAFIPRRYTCDINKICDVATSNAHGRSQGLCALYVRKALKAGGCCTWGHPLSAKRYNDLLTALDFSKIPVNDYHPQRGDIVVFNVVAGHPYGHIAIWNGKQWVSDFFQKNFYVSPSYKRAHDYQIFRMEKSVPKRHFTLSHHLNGLSTVYFSSTTAVEWLFR